MTALPSLVSLLLATQRHAARMTATPTPPLTSHTANFSPNRENVCGRLALVESDIVSVMADRVRTDSGECHAQTHVQSGISPRKCRTRAYAEAMASLRTLAEPFSIRSAAEALGWSYEEARYWCEKARADRDLDADRRGHRWTEKGRAA